MNFPDSVLSQNEWLLLGNTNFLEEIIGYLNPYIGITMAKNILFHVMGCCLYKISSDHSMGIQLEVNWGGGTYPEASMEVG